jgi:hypothetical protein
MAGYERDPLSVRFDAAAGRFVTRVLAAWDGGRNGGWVDTLVAPPSERLIAWALARDIDALRIRYTGRGSGIETMYEAAFRRAVFYDDRIYLWDKHGGDWTARDRPQNPHRVAALEFTWGKRTGGYRRARARAHSVGSASRYAARANPYDRV